MYRQRQRDTKVASAAIQLAVSAVVLALFLFVFGRENAIYYLWANVGLATGVLLIRALAALAD